jgi:hypothetical protein
VSKYEAEDNVRKTLRDPGSAQFSNVYVNRRGTLAAVCGSVNSKNGFGGYGGEKQFFVVNGIALVEPDEYSSRYARGFKAACLDTTAPPVRKK